MKSKILIGSALLVLSNLAHASQSRLQALGMDEIDNDGMYYIQDSRNIFLNPAYIHGLSDQVMMEWGDDGLNVSATGSASNATVRTDNNPKAQGGVIKKYGDMVYGLYYGNESNTSSFLRIAATSGAAIYNGVNPGQANASQMLKTADNQIDLFVAGSNMAKWGASLVYASGKDDAVNSKDSAVAAKLGVLGEGWDAHLNVSLVGKSESSSVIDPLGLNGGLKETVTQEFKGKLGTQLGGSYKLPMGGKLFGYYKQFNWEQSDSYSKYTALNGAFGNQIGQQGTVKGDFKSMYLGWGSEMEVNSGDKIYTSVAAKKTDVNLEFSAKSEVRHMIVPLTIGYEARATDWLTLRGSIIQNLYGTRNNKNINNAETKMNAIVQQLIVDNFGGSGEATLANSTEVRAGATLTFGQLAIDGLIGTTGANGTAGANAGVLSASSLETSVGVTYKF